MMLRGRVLCCRSCMQHGLGGHSGGLCLGVAGGGDAVLHACDTAEPFMVGGSRGAVNVNSSNGHISVLVNNNSYFLVAVWTTTRCSSDLYHTPAAASTLHIALFDLDVATDTTTVILDFHNLFRYQPFLCLLLYLMNVAGTHRYTVIFNTFHSAFLHRITSSQDS